MKDNNTPEKKSRYDSAYISHFESGDAAAVLITRDIATSIPTAGMWIDILYADKKKRSDGRWEFHSFIAELFPRITRPTFPENASDEEKKYITCFAIVYQSAREGSLYGVYLGRFTFKAYIQDETIPELDTDSDS